MSVNSTSTLEQLLHECDLGWMLHRFASDPSESLAAIRDILGRTNEAARRRLGEEAPQLDDTLLAAIHEKNPHKVEAFLQALASTQNPEMLVMTWRLLHDAQIDALALTYRASETFHMRIELPPGKDDTPDIYESGNITDLSLLRHIGITKVNGQPLLDGFYALRLG